MKLWWTEERLTSKTCVMKKLRVRRANTHKHKRTGHMISGVLVSVAWISHSLFCIFLSLLVVCLWEQERIMGDTYVTNQSFTREDLYSLNPHTDIQCNVSLTGCAHNRKFTFCHTRQQQIENQSYWNLFRVNCVAFSILLTTWTSDLNVPPHTQTSHSLR